MSTRRMAVWGLNLIVFFFCSSLALAQDQDLIPQPGKPLTLDQVRAIAIKFHPSLVATKETVLANKALVEQALAAYYPQVNLNNSYTAFTTNFSSSPISNPSGGAIGVPTAGPNRWRWTFTDVLNTGLAASQTIYDFGRTSNNVTINRENVKASQEAVSITRMTVILNVDQAYYSVLQTKRLIAVAEDTVKQTKEHLEQAQGFYQAGTHPKIDVTKAEVDMANAELALIQARNNYLVALVTLNIAMGLRQDLQYEIEDSLSYKPREITQAEILKTAFEQRPELIQFQALERAQVATIQLAKAGYYPILSGNASYLYRGTGFDQTFYWDAFLGASMVFPLFAGFYTPAQIAQAQATLRSLKAQEENTKLNIRLQGEQAYLGLKLADEQIRVTEKAVGQAQENYDLATGRYQVGVGSPLEITDAEVSLANARANYIQALYNYKIAEAKIDNAMGLYR
ncbi:MAG: TolC family protein [Thermodesulfobacteriota bacterium]